MSATADQPHLNSHHKDTVDAIFRHPTSHNIEWHDVLSLLEAIATVEERHDGRYHLVLGEADMVISRPRHKDIDTQLVVDLRNLLSAAGYGPKGGAATPVAQGDEPVRDFGDGRWGETGSPGESSGSGTAR
jgi:hypothetical protein